MNKQWLVLTACLALLILAGCTGRSATDRCGAWDWYCPCDLVEGQQEKDCGPCGYPDYKAGQVVRRAVAVRASDCAPVADPAPLPAPAPVAPPAPAPMDLPPAPPVDLPAE